MSSTSTLIAALSTLIATLVVVSLLTNAVMTTNYLTAFNVEIAPVAALVTTGTEVSCWPTLWWPLIFWFFQMLKSFANKPSPAKWPYQNQVSLKAFFEHQKPFKLVVRRPTELSWGKGKVCIWPAKQPMHTAGACPGFYGIKQLGGFLLPPGWDASPL